MNTLTGLKRLKITACYAKRWKPPSTEYNKRGLRQHLHKIIFIKIFRCSKVYPSSVRYGRLWLAKNVPSNNNTYFTLISELLSILN